MRLSHGLEALVAFTWEKCLANSNGDFGAENGSEGNPVQYYFAPRLAKKGFGKAELQKVLIDNPRRLLAF